MLRPCNQELWQGRIDPGVKNRWHERVNQDIAAENNLSLIGFCCDEGVRRNQGRVGARSGPDAIRSMLANLVYPTSAPLVDRGNVHCEGTYLETAQNELAETVATDLGRNNLPIVLGGGHEVAWGSYQGIRKVHPKASIGIINFDAHFDLRPIQFQSSSGTPFRQIAEWSEAQKLSFNYFVMGINAGVNTPSLFEYAERKNVQWVSDIDMGARPIEPLGLQLLKFCENVERIYVTICLDVFPAQTAPGVSAPASLGVNPLIVIQLIHYLKKFRHKTLLLDIAEMNPVFDIDNRTARLAARLVQEFISN